MDEFKWWGRRRRKDEKNKEKSEGKERVRGKGEVSQFEFLGHFTNLN